MGRQSKPYQIANQIQKEIPRKLIQAKESIKNRDKKTALELIDEVLLMLDTIKDLRNLKYPRD